MPEVEFHLHNEVGIKFPPLRPVYSEGELYFDRFRSLVARSTETSVIGEGGTGRIHLVRDEMMDREVALKIPLESILKDPAAREDVIRETRQAMDLTHPNIVRIHDFHEDRKQWGISMQYVRGKNLDEWRYEGDHGGLRRLRPYSVETIRDWVAQICDALRYVHEDAHMVHRDIKPKNLMLEKRDGGEKIYITDFGISQRLRQHTMMLSRDQSKAGENKGNMGTLPYMSWEQIVGAPASPLDDVYAVGATIYELITGRPPFYDGAFEQIKVQIREVVPPSMEQRMFDLGLHVPPPPPEWERVVAACLAKKAEDRPQSIRAVAEGLGFHAGNRTVPVSFSAAPTLIDHVFVESINTQLTIDPNLALEVTHHKAAELLLDETETVSEDVGVVQDVDGKGSRELTEKEKHAALLQLMQARASYSSTPALPEYISSPPLATPEDVAVMPVSPALSKEQCGTPSAAVEAIDKSSSPLLVKRFKKVKSLVLWFVSACIALVKGMSNGAKAALATTIGLIVIALAGVMLSRGAEGKANKRYNELVALAAMPNTKELPVTKKDLDILLNAATSLTASNSNSSETVYKALYIAEATDGTDVDAVLADYTTQTAIQEDIRVNILRRVIGGRRSVAVVPTLIAFVNSNPKPDSAAAALEAIRAVADETHFKDLLGILEFSNDGNIRKRCEEGVVAIIKKSSNRTVLSDSIEHAYSAATLPEVKHALLRCLGATGSPKAKEILVSTLKSQDKMAQIAAADASKNWPDDSMFEEMMEILEETTDETVRPRMFHSSREFLLMESKRDEMDAKELWRMLAINAKTDEEQEAVIRALADNPADWAMVVVEYFQDKAESDKVIDLSGKALDRMRPKKEASEIRAHELQEKAAAEAAKPATPATASKNKPFENTLGMKFVPIGIHTGGKTVLFSIWETRVKDFAAFLEGDSSYDYEDSSESWIAPETHPVTFVSHEDAVAFCEWLTAKDRRSGKIGSGDSYRLPSDAEWSYAVGIGDKEDAEKTPEEKSGKIEIYPWNDGKGTWPPPKGAGNYHLSASADSYERTSSVGSFTANANGLYDLGGNVSEWCIDSYNANMYLWRVLRGASWRDQDRQYLSSSHRFYSIPGNRYGDYGFRCVLVSGS